MMYKIRLNEPLFKTIFRVPYFLYLYFVKVYRINYNYIHANY